MANKFRPFLNKKLTPKIIGAMVFFIAGILAYPLVINMVPGKKFPTPHATTTNISNNKQDIEDLNVCFTPNQSCLPQILKYIDNAKSSIFLLGYSFTSKPLAAALIKAKNRGVVVRVVLDHSQKNQKPSLEAIKLLLAAKITIHLDYSVKIAHNKIIVIDDCNIITGSYNWSNSAEFNNAENLVFIKSTAMTQKYKALFEERWKVSKPFQDVQLSSTKVIAKHKRYKPKSLRLVK